MAKIAVILNLDPESVVATLAEAAQQIDGVEGELVLDLSSLSRISSNVVGALQHLAVIADRKAVKIILRGATIDIYKTLKLLKLTDRFTFVN